MNVMLNVSLVDIYSARIAPRCGICVGYANQSIWSTNKLQKKQQRSSIRYGSSVMCCASRDVHNNIGETSAQYYEITHMFDLNGHERSKQPIHTYKFDLIQYINTKKNNRRSHYILRQLLCNYEYIIQNESLIVLIFSACLANKFDESKLQSFVQFSLFPYC